ncbi:MAG: hypothetical protein ACP5TG_04935 [Thermoplasmata archaeon]
MFDQEIINSFEGGFRIAIPSVATIIGSPPISISGYSLSFPLSLQQDILVRRNNRIEWIDKEIFVSEYRLLSTDGNWSDPLKIMANISKQRGWENGLKAIVNNGISFNSGTGYMTSFISSVILSFSLVNGIKLPNSEILQLNTEIQEKVIGNAYYNEALTQLEGRKNNLLFSEGRDKKFRNEIINFEPYSIFLIEENSLDVNSNLGTFRRYRKKFVEENMMKRDKNQLKYPYSSIASHYEKEMEYYLDMKKAAEINDVISFLNTLSEYSQSVMFNLSALSQFQKIMGDLLLKNGAEYFSFNVSEYSGSILLFGDAPTISKIKDNVIREYYSATNKTVNFREVNISGPVSYEKIII